MASNFDFLAPLSPELKSYASRAEQHALSDPRAACFYARFALEQTVYWLYRHTPQLHIPYSDAKLNTLIKEQSFKDHLPHGLFGKIKAIQISGNNAVHKKTSPSISDSTHIVKELHHLLKWVLLNYSSYPAPSAFNGALFPAPQAGVKKQSQESLKKLEQELDEAKTIAELYKVKAEQTEAELQEVKAKLDAILTERHQEIEQLDLDEADTRKFLIDVSLHEAGWTDTHIKTEVEVSGMPVSTNPSGIGFVDYVLLGSNHKPIAVVEAKRSMLDPQLGRQQAKLYADCLEQQHGQRPFIYYSNGYDTYFWDDQHENPRQVAGFHRQERLERITWRHDNARPLSEVEIKAEITNRDYQIEAITRVCEEFTNNRRKALIHMATGTGKTRTAVSLVDRMIRANRAERVLFLADRTALVTQAGRAFKAHLPKLNSSITTLGSGDHQTSKIVLATYQTLSGYINRFKSSGERELSIGHFDLIIVDEAHRSVYKKYGEIFNYFDALMVGLTATPRDEESRDTYDVFGLATGEPTFSYDLPQAVREGYLVNFKVINAKLKFLREGITYSKLKDAADRDEYEEMFRDEETGELPDQVSRAALNKWVFNKQTTIEALRLLFDKGYRINGGETLGKTIIFARNHRHALHIEKVFNELYPELPNFCRVIDSHDKKAQSTLDEFANEEDIKPQIAISVDMLDTGVDVPSIVNLVFFKPVYSKTKFHQMIGRGTRLCEDLYGPGEHKTGFRIIDLLGNFEFFEQQPDRVSPPLPITLTARVYQHKLKLLRTLQSTEGSDGLKTDLWESISGFVNKIDDEHYATKSALEAVEEWKKNTSVTKIDDEQAIRFKTTISSLPAKLDKDDYNAKRFDVFCHKIQIALLSEPKLFIKLKKQMVQLLAQLETLESLPPIRAKLSLISNAQTEGWWEDIDVETLDILRLDIRGLISLIPKVQTKIVYTAIKEDELLNPDSLEYEVDLETMSLTPTQYKVRVESFLKQHKDHEAINKVWTGKRLEESDLNALNELLFSTSDLGSQSDFEEVYGADATLNLPLFIRQMVGLEEQAVKAAFADYLLSGAYNANQIRLVSLMIEMLCEDGVLSIDRVFEDRSILEIHPMGIMGVFEEIDLHRIMGVVTEFNESVGYGMAA